MKYGQLVVILVTIHREHEPDDVLSITNSSAQRHQIVLDVYWHPTCLFTDI